MKRFLNTENLIVAAVIFLAIFFAKFPTLYNWLNTPKGYWYPKNTSFFDAWDINTYVSYIRYGQRHGIALQDTYTTTPHKPVFIYQYYTGLGLLNRILNLDPFILFHLASIITSIFLLLVCYQIVKLFFEDIVYRVSSFIFVALGGGLGWAGLLNISLDTKLAGFTLVNALERGHDALTTILLLLTLFFMLIYLQKKKGKYMFWSIISGFISITLHPPFIILYVLASIILAVLEFKQSKRFKIGFAAPVSLLLFGFYYLFVLTGLFNNPGYDGLVNQNLFSADSFGLTLGLGPIVVFILWSLISGNRDELKHAILKLFFLLQLFFLFSPFGFHLYFAKGLWVWAAILGFYGIKSLISNVKIQNVAITAVVAVSLITRLYVFTQLMESKVNNPFFFLTKSEGDALGFMSALPKDKAAVSLYRIGNYIPAHTDLKVYYGHKYQTPNSTETLRRAQVFYTKMDEEDQRKFLADNHIDYIYYGWEEANLLKDNKRDPVNPFSYFPVLYSNDSSIVYGIDKSISK